MKEAKAYQKKPVKIQAIQWTGDNLKDVIRFTGWHKSASEKWTWEEYKQVVKEKGLKIFTMEGSYIAKVGSYIIKGVEGEFYPCDDRIFNKTYELVKGK